MSDAPLLRRIGWLTQALLFSVTVNVGLLAHFVLRDLPKQEGRRRAPTQGLSVNNERVLQQYSLLSFAQLLECLEDPTLVEEGLKRRDLALACLVAFHHLNLERALGGVALQRRVLSFRNPDGQQSIEIGVFPGLQEHHFQATLTYAKTEKWPLTSKGLFFELRRNVSAMPPSLVEAFSFTPEYRTIQALFRKTQVSLAAPSLVQLLLEGEWEDLTAFAEAMQADPEWTAARRQLFLHTYLRRGSRSAALLLLRCDQPYLMQRFEDEEILYLIELLPDRARDVEPFAKALLVSVRSDAVRKRAALLLGVERGGEPVAKRTHVVQQGESLWKIAQHYRVSIDAIMRHNHLREALIRPGMALQIPDQGTGSLPPGQPG